MEHKLKKPLILALILIVLAIFNSYVFTAYTNEFQVTPDVTPFNDSEGSGGPVVPIDELVITSQLFMFNITTEQAANCSYHILNLTDDIIMFDYSNATTGPLGPLDQGTLELFGTSGTVHQRIINHTPRGDVERVRYGFYCTNGTAQAYSDLIFTIDTTPPNIVVNETNITQVSFLDGADNTISPEVIHDNGLIYSDTRQLSMLFSTNEPALCRYESTNSSTNIHTYSQMSNNIPQGTESDDHIVNITPKLGEVSYFHVGCIDDYDNADNLSQVQTVYESTGVMFLLKDPSCSEVNLNVNDTPADNGGSISVEWNRSSQDGQNEDYVTHYALYRIGNESAGSAISTLNKNDLYEMDVATYTSLTNLANFTATGAQTYSFEDATTTDGVGYYYYLLAFYNNQSNSIIMQNVGRNMSCSTASALVNSTDDDFPQPITNLRTILSLGDLSGSSLRLNWTQSSDDGAGADDVRNYTILRQIFGTPEEAANNYTIVSVLGNNVNTFLDTGLNYNNTYCYFVMTTDTSNLSTNSSRICAEPNSQPFFYNVSTEPTLVRTNDGISCTALISDVDGDNLQGNVVFNWTILRLSTFETTVVSSAGACTPPIAPGPFGEYNFENFTTECVSSLASTNFVKGDKVWCSVVADDSIEFARDTTTNETFTITDFIAINNTAPNASNVQIVPSIPNGSSNLFCNYTFSDVDSDNENSSLTLFKWYINNDALNSFTEILGQNAQTLNSIYIDQNDQVICSVKPHDADTTWINNSLSAENYLNSSLVTIIDNSVPQVVNFSADPLNGGNVTLVGENVVFSAEWLDVDVGEQAQMYVCDEFATSENQEGTDFDTNVRFGDNTSNGAITTTFYTNETGRYVNEITIEPYKFQRNDFYVYAAESEVESGDVDDGDALVEFPDDLTFYDSDLSSLYTAGETIVNDTNNDLIFDASVDVVIRGNTPAFLSSLTRLNSSSQKFVDKEGTGDYNASIDVIYFDADDSDTINADDRRLEVYTEDNSSIDFTPPLYDMYVYEVDYPGESTEDKTLIAQDNNNWFVVGTENNFNPQYNAQPLPNKYLAFVLCIDVNDDGICDSTGNNKNDSVYVQALDSAPSGDIYLVNDSSKAGAGDYNPDIIINYEFVGDGGCLSKSYCNTTLSTETQISCSYTVQAGDNQTTPYYLRVCDDDGACSVARQGSFVVNNIPGMVGVFVGSNANSTDVGTDSNLMCMHLGATDEVISIGDFIIDGDGAITIFGDVRNSRDTGLSDGDAIIAFNASNAANLSWDRTFFEDGLNKNKSTYQLNNDALVIDEDGNGFYNETDTVLYNPFNSLRIGDALLPANASSTNLSFHDSNSDGLFTWDTTFPEDIVYNNFGYDNTTFNEDINFTFLWYVKPSGDTEFRPATNFTWYDNDFNDILTQGNTMPGDEWLCQVTPYDDYGFGVAQNSSSVVIGSEGDNPTLAPSIITVVDDSNETSPTTIGDIITISINYSDPDSDLVRAYVCDSSAIIRNSGCFEKEFNRTTNNAPANTIATMNISFEMGSEYTMSPTNYTVMLCDPDYYCSDIWQSNASQNVTFYANIQPLHDTLSPSIVPNPPGDLFTYPRNYSSLNNLLCNVSWTDTEDTSGSTTYNSDNATFTWYRTRGGITTTQIAGFPGSLGGNILSNAQTLNNDTWVCQATIADSFGGQSVAKNSSAVIIGTVVTSSSFLPLINNVVSNTNESIPLNYGDILNLTIEWQSFSSPNVTFFLCNSTNVNFTGCLGRTIATGATSVSPYTLSYTVTEDDMQYFGNATPYTVNYTLLMVNNLGGSATTYIDDITTTEDDFAVNYAPTVSNIQVSGSDALVCSYTFSDADNQSITSNTTSQYAANESIFAWYNETTSGYDRFTFPLTPNTVPAFITNEGDNWICEVTPYDGYVFGETVNSSMITAGQTLPIILSYQLLGGNGSASIPVSNSSPINLGDLLYINVTWTDPNNNATKLLVLNNDSIIDGVSFFESTGFSTQNPINGFFNTSLLSNLTTNENLSHVTNNFTFRLQDSDNNVTAWITDTEILDVFLNRIPSISESQVNVSLLNQSGIQYFSCAAGIVDPDTYSTYQANSSSLTYAWYSDSGFGYARDFTQNLSTVPLSLVADGERWLCQVTPCDNYSCGTAVNSSSITSLNETPQILDIDVFTTYQNGTFTQNNASYPAIYGENLLFNITWSDSDLFLLGESADVYVCENQSSTSLGCIGTLWCSNISTDGVASCVVNTSRANLTLYNTSANEINYTVIVYDDSGLSSEYSTVSTFVVDQAPFVVSNSITPADPTNTSVLTCNYAISDLDTYASFNGTDASPLITWYLNRSGIVTQTGFPTNLITPDQTQKLDRWLCEITPVNGTVVGTPLNSSWVTIGNAVPYLDTPNITAITVSSNYTHPTVVGDYVLFSINWTDAQAPDERIHVIICDTPDIVNSTGCQNTTYANFNGTTANPAIASYLVKEADVGNKTFFAKVCDDSGLCSTVYNSSAIAQNFSINHKPEVDSVNITVLASNNLFCDYTFTDTSSDFYQTDNSVITWFRANGSESYCGDGVVDNGIGEQCDGDQFITNDCGIFNPGFEIGEGELRCNQATCQINTDLCIPVNTSQAYCGNNITDLSFEQCDGPDFGNYSSCSDIGSFTGGSLACNSDCTLDVTSCFGGASNFCGNGILEFGEECEYTGSLISGEYDSCSDFTNFLGGTLSCNSNCEYDTSQCVASTDIYADLNVTGQILPQYAFSSEDIIICQVTPYDGYSYGLTVLSDSYTGVNETPQVTSVIAYDNEDPTNAIINNITQPITYGKDISINITWEDFNRFGEFGENVKLFLCSDTNATYQGCIATQYCEIPLTSQTDVGCTFNTSNITIPDQYNNNSNLTFYIHVYDDSLNTSVINTSVYVNRLPIISDYAIETLSGNIVPIDTDNLFCNFTLTDPDSTLNITPEMNQTNSYIEWYYFRSGIWNSFENGGGATIANSFTEVGDNWICEITYGDGILNASPINTSQVTIQNSVYNLTSPNITALTIISGNEYLNSPVTETGPSGATIYKSDNSTNVGDIVNFSVEWVDFDQLSNASEMVQVFVCSTPQFSNGCLDDTLVYVPDTNDTIVNFTYVAQDSDDSIQNISVYVCDDSWDCSGNVSTNFTVNHAPGNFTPEILIYTNSSSDQIFECDYEFGYNFRNGSNDVNASGSRILDDDILSATFSWYYSAGGSSFTELSETTQSISVAVGDNDKIICAVNVADVYGLTSGLLNSSELDLSLLPIVWPPSSVLFNSEYVLVNNLSDANESISIYGILPTTEELNVSVKSFSGFEAPFANISSNLLRSSSVEGNSTIAISTENGTSYILVDRVSSITSKFAVGNHIELSGHNLSYFERYNITSAPVEVQPNIYRIDIDPALNTTVQVGEIATVYSGLTSKYPVGWFNLSIGLRNGSNLLKVASNDSGTLGPSNTLSVVFDADSPEVLVTIANPTQTATPVITFNLSDDHVINVTSVIVNISNGTDHIYHFTSDSEVNISAYTNDERATQGSDVICGAVNDSFYDCSLTANINDITTTNDLYTLTIEAEDYVGRNGTYTQTFSENNQEVGIPVTFATPIQNSTSFTYGLLINNSNITAIEYAVGTAPYPDDGWDTVIGPTNLSDFNLTRLTKFVDFNYNIYFNDGEALINSSDLKLSTDDIVVSSGLGLKNFINPYERFNCTGIDFNHSCYIVFDANNDLTYNAASDTILYNASPHGFSLAEGSSLNNFTSSTWYVDVNNDSLYTLGEPVFNSTNNTIENISAELLINSSTTALTLSVNTTNLNVSAEQVYRVSARFYINGTAAPSAWAFTNPIVYKPDFESTTFLGPSEVTVYDVNASASEPGTLIDVAYDNQLQFSWTASTPQRPEEGEFVLRYEYALGYEPYPFDGWNAIHSWSPTSDNTTLTYALNATTRSQLVTGNTYYLTVRSLSSFGLYSENSSSNGIVYNDLTPPALSLVRVGNINSSPYVVDSQQDPLVAVVQADENISQCGFSTFRTPFDSNYIITRECNAISSDNQTFVTCNLTQMDGSAVEEGDQTYYISCLDVNQNGNPAVGTNPTLEMNFTYNFPDAPNVTNVTLYPQENESSTPLTTRSYVYANEYLFCEYNVTDADGDSIANIDYAWQKNGDALPVFENESVLNLSRHNARRADNFSCSVQAQDSTGRYSDVRFSTNMTVNNTPPSAVTFITENNTYAASSINLRWNYGVDVDVTDILEYYIIIMNKTSFGPLVTLNDTISTQNETNNFNYDISVFADGTYFWKIQTCDNSSYSNNCTNSTDAYSFVKDSQGPIINILTPDNDSTISDTFTVIADVYDENEPHVNVTNVFAEFYNASGVLNLSINLTLNNNSLYEGSVDGNLTAGNYTLRVNASDTLGNIGSQSKIIIVDTDQPILQIDWPPFVFREQYLNSNFALNLTGYNATTFSYFIYNDSETIQNNSVQFVLDQTSYTFTDTVNVSNLGDGKYYINFSSVNSVGNYESKTAWFAVDKTPPTSGTSSYTQEFRGSPQTLSVEWFNNSLVPDDNQYGVQRVEFFYNISDQNPANLSTISFQMDNATGINNANYSYTVLGSQFETTSAYIMWYTCAYDFAGNRACSNNVTVSIPNRAPVSNATIQDVFVYEEVGNDTIVLNQTLVDLDNESLGYYAVLLPTGTLLYDPMDSPLITGALGAEYAGISTSYTNLIAGNATLLDRAHINLLTNPDLEESTIFTDMNGTINSPAPTGWQLINNASYDNVSGVYNYTIFGSDDSGVRVSAKSYFYQDVNISAGSTYSLSQYMRSETGTITGRLQINWLNASNDFISTTVNISDNDARPNLTTTWQRYNLTVTAPTGASVARVFLSSDDNATFAYIDNIVLEESSLTIFNADDHVASYIKYPKHPNNSNLPYINDTQGTFEISLQQVWSGNNTLERFIVDTSSTGTDRFYIKTDDAGNISFAYGDADINASIINWTNESVHRLAFTWNSSLISYYYNGSLVNSSSVTTQPNISEYFYVGAAANGTSQIEALVDELVIFDHVKNSSGILYDFNTKPVTNATNNDSSNYTLIFLNATIENSTASSQYSVVLFNVSPITSNSQPNLTYTQRAQFFGSDGSSLIASNVINIIIQTNDNIYVNVNLYNDTGVFQYTNNIIEDELNNITSSQIYNSNLSNYDDELFEIRSSIINLSDVNLSRIVFSTLFNSSLNYSNVSQQSVVNTSSIVNSTVQNSIIRNSTFIRNVTVINSTVLDSTLQNVYLVNASIDPTVLINVTGNNHIIFDSSVYNSEANDSEIYNATVFNSTIINCTISTIVSPSQGIIANVTLNNSFVTGTGQDSNCQLMNGTAIVNQSGNVFVYDTSVYSNQPLVSDILNLSPNTTFSISNGSTITGPDFNINVTILDDNLNSTINDFVSVTWVVDFDISAAHTQFTNNTNTLNGTNISLAKLTYNITEQDITGINVSFTAVDLFGNTFQENFSGITYDYEASSPACSDGIDNDGDNLTDYPNDPGCSSSSDTDETDPTTTPSSGGSSGGGGGGGASRSTLYCYNGKLDKARGETGIDCGGRCVACEALCTDGKLNGLEEKTDCGGACGACTDNSITGNAVNPGNCRNGIKDSDEEGVDCGGVCIAQCQDEVVVQPTPPRIPTCTDGIQNGNEQGIDCGGSCGNACVVEEESSSFMSSFLGNWWIALLLILLILLIALGIIIFHKKDHIKETIVNKPMPIDNGQSIVGAIAPGLYAKQHSSAKGPVSDSIIELEKYIIKCLDSGMRVQAIKELLSNAQWAEPVVEVVLHKIMMTGEKLEEIEKYVVKQIKKGATDDQIKSKLIKSHWSSEIVDIIIVDVHKISEDKKRIHDYMIKKLDQGLSLDEIQQILTSIGWNEKYIEKLSKKYTN